MMSDDAETAKPAPAPPPGDQARSNAGNPAAKPLGKQPDPAEPGSQGPKQTNAGERS